MMEPEVLESPDGDPRKRGTITAAVPLVSGGAMTRHPDEVPHPGGRPVVATRERGLVVARDRDDAARILREDRSE